MQESRHGAGWLAALGLAYGAAEAATAALRPRTGLVAARPVAVEDHFTAAELERARRFGRPQLALAGLAALVDAGVLAWLVRRGRGARAEEEGKGVGDGESELASPRRARRSVAAAAVAGAELSTALTVAGLPVSAVMRKRALDAGLVTQSWRGWAGDAAKTTAIGGALAGAGAALVRALMGRWGERWWLPGGVALSAVATGLTFAGPVVLDPIFNRFSPLADDDVRDDLLALARAAGVRVENVYQVDASRRTTAANAYVNGLGATRRVVLFDTRLEQFSRAETRLVVAHELAHVRHRDVPRSLVHLGLIAPAALRAADRLGRRLDRVGRAGPVSLPALTLALGVVGACVGASTNRLSRGVERRADGFALGLTDAPDAFTSFERRIVLANLADPDPPWWLTALLATHPPAVERIGIAAAYAAGRRGEQAAQTGAPRESVRPTRGWTRRTPAGS